MEFLLSKESGSLNTDIKPEKVDDRLVNNNTDISLSTKTSEGIPTNDQIHNEVLSSKEFNSSSETCITDEEVANDASDVLDRNFNCSNPGDLKKTIEKSKEEVFLENVASSEPVLEDSARNYVNSSPNKSIMKRTNSSSPRKSVVFTSSNPEIHHYPDSGNASVLSADDKVSVPYMMSHEWNELNNKSSSDGEGSTPPAPPPHTSSSFTSLLSSGAKDDIDISSLNDIRLKQGKFSNLSLNEKMDIYLSSKNNRDDLDEQLSNLQNAMKHKADYNINHLSFGLQKMDEDIENPLDSLSRNSEIQLRSSGSSQSSLQSLKDTNRTLESINLTDKNKGLQVHDGVKGFSNEFMESLLPTSQEKLEGGDTEQLTKKEDKSESSDNDIFHDSFNDNTEQIIMNLLKSNKINESSEEMDAVSRTSYGGSSLAEIKEKPCVVNASNSPRVAIKTEMHEKGEEKQLYSSTDPGIKKEYCIKSASSMNSEVCAKYTKDEKLDPDAPQTDEITKFDNSKSTDTDESNFSAQFSLRFHMDSDWKLEDSNDGDREDNEDTTNICQPNVQVEMMPPKMPITKSKGTPMTSSESIQEFMDASDDLTKRISEQKLKIDEAIDATIPPSPIQEMEEARLTSLVEDGTEILANSSNIAPPNGIALPLVEINNNSFDDFTRHLNSTLNTYEESLSAEHDQESKQVDFITIWRSQRKQRRDSQKDHTQNVYNLSVLGSPSQSSYVSKLIQPANKKLKEVNVMSRRIISPDFEDLNVSGFLPEISEDSGFEGKFRNIIDRSTTINLFHLSKPSSDRLDTRNILATKDSSYLQDENSRQELSKKRIPLRVNTNFSIQQPAQKPQAETRPSKFKVPSFEIKRTASLLSPRNQYNDIFEDLIGPPTIKSEGMKTLPSMDRDDIKRILSAKQVLTQNEYSNIKLKDIRPQKNSIVQPNNEYEDLHLHASIYDTSTDSSVLGDGRTSRFELSKVQNNQILGGFGTLNEDSSNANSIISSQKSIPPKVMTHGNQSFPEPESEFIGSPEKPSTIFKTPPLSTLTADLIGHCDTKTKDLSPINSLPQVELPHTPIGPKIPQTPTGLPLRSNKSKPIKIGSPLKLVKDGNSVTAVELIKSPKSHSKHNSFSGKELLNSKLRESQGSVDEKEHKHAISTVSVPSNILNTTKESNDIENSAPVAPGLKERGKLFLRVIALKGIQLPDIRQHNADFSVTLDNGVHCIKTPSFKMETNHALIGKEFEMTVGHSLQFILTMKSNYERPRGKLVEVKERRIVKSKNKLSRMFGSKDIITTTRFVPTQASDSWGSKIAQDGSFARCYIDMLQYEDQITAKACNFDIACFNEWETISKNQEIKRVNPYRICMLEVKMLFIPRTDQNEALPTSIKAAYDCIDELKEEVGLSYEGYLDQEGGDCETWKRRYFKLSGTSLIAHSEYTHKTRAKINLAKVVNVIYIDKENLNNSSPNYRNFSDVLLMDQVFKLKFANGEIIDFGCPVRSERLHWISLFEKIIHRNKLRHQPWAKLMMGEIDSSRHAYSNLI
ncbi:uncharacterized protein PRCAT00005684001 [Priceomyces carsonii]|uniref:uncharacterized protein n=1 Tax=Priceomyces carsonii TaxID=28549 RepID=UPI002ED9216D|nr:unnamed protein product [Priceomyces carsonii]